MNKKEKEIYDAIFSNFNSPKSVAPARILGLKDDSFWSVLSESDTLSLCHFNSKASTFEEKCIRGTIVDTEKEIVVCPGCEYTEVFHVKDDMNLSDAIKELNIEDEIIIKMSPGFEGVIIRVFWWNNKMYTSSLKRLELGHSRWGTTRQFSEMFNEGSGNIQPEELFDTSKPYSSTVYTYMVVDYEMIVATKNFIDKAFLVLIDQYEIDWKSEDIAPGRCTREIIHEYPIYPKSGNIYKIPLLTEGFDDKFRDLLALNHNIIMKTENYSFRLVDTTYKDRCAIHGGNNNVKLRFHELIVNILAHKNYNFNMSILKPLYPVISPDTKLPIIENVLPGTIKTTDDKIKCVWANIIYHRENPDEKILGLWNEYKREFNGTLHWLLNVERHEKGSDYSLIPDDCKEKPAIVFFLTAVRKSIQKKISIKIKEGLSYNRKSIAKETMKSFLSTNRTNYDIFRCWRLRFAE